ncbi:lipopolysaccharide biosynthesis protein [Streptomyces sp. NBC_01498]|uniref:lipopolysaccharide biosynthesis protein n=1 Tax=Streptomyces sp. NBC_01498 TaxID=2975870 RepID=UPI002E7BB164|nr:lipopolysaccharide biosynthesis protein [Streptomyces sp. NBC_01498]WTL26547.1 lipopolysaccharide biosynthesis protein [Streptomyces sp. NBC_01498]
MARGEGRPAAYAAPGPAAGDARAPSDAKDGPGDLRDRGDSMFRNAYALMLSTGVSAALGLGFWLVAARHYTDEAVGQGSAAIAAMRLLASLTATTMIGAVVRYVPRAGRATGALVWRVYAVSSAVVCLACVVFLLTLDLWGASYAPLGGLTAGLLFTASCVGWALLTLQDGVLTGLRRAFWVPVGNAAFSLGKLLLLVAFATALPVLGVFVSWAAAIALSVLPLGWLVFRRLIPRQAAADRDREPPRTAEIGRFLAGDSVGALFSLAMINLLPVMVAVRFDAAHNAYFYTAYTVGGTMEFMAINMASSLTAHASHSPERLAEGVRGALRRMTVLLVPVVLVLVVFAPRILAPFGADYAEHGSTVLRLLAAAALPRVVVELYIGVLRVQGRTGMLAALQGAMCVSVLGSAVLLLGPAGISGAGLAMLLSMTLVALFAAPGLRSALRGRGEHGNGRRDGSPAQGRGREQGRGRAEEYGTTWAREAAERGRRRGGGPLDATEEAAYRAAWARGTTYAPSGYDTATPAFGLPVHIPPKAAAPAEERFGSEGHVEPPEPAPASGPRGKGPGAALALWPLLLLAAGLFWVPLRDAAELGAGPVPGARLLAALPPWSLGGGVLLVVVQCAAVALVRSRPLLLAAGTLALFGALHGAPALLGVRPPALAGPGHRPLVDALAQLPWPEKVLDRLPTTLPISGSLDPPGLLPVLLPLLLPVLLQVLCLGSAAVVLRAARLDGRVVASVVWVLAVAGWAAQRAFADVAVPVSLGLLGLAATAVLARITIGKSRTRS